jgi:hypothetical protein
VSSELIFRAEADIDHPFFNGSLSSDSAWEKMQGDLF